MNATPHTIRRLAAAIGLAATFVALAVPAAFAGGQSGAIVDGRSPDTRDAAVRAQLASPLDRRSPDTRDAAVAAQRRSLRVLDGRSPDTIDAAALARGPVATLAASSSFDWADFGIGAALAAFALLMLAGLGAGALAARQSRGKKAGSVRAA